MSALAKLGAFVSGGRPRELAAECRDPLLLHLVDTVGAGIAGGRTVEGATIFRLQNQLFAGDALSSDILAQCAVTRLSEVDDIHLAAMITPGSIVIPAAIAIAAHRPPRDAGELSAAIVCGYEAMVRLGLALDGPTILYRFMWPTYLAAPFGTAAVASRLLGLNATQAAHALALSLTWAAPGTGRHGAASGARWLSIGQAARNGYTAVLAAQAGFTADLSLFEGGFFRDIYNIAPDMSAILDRLGDGSALPEVSFKPWCAARQTMAAVQALKDVLAEGAAPNDMIRVEAFVIPPHLRMINHGVEPGDRASCLTSLPYQLALAALSPDMMLDVHQSSEQIPDRIRTFMEKIQVQPDEGLLSDYPRTWPARVAVTTASGRREVAVMHVPGDPARRFEEMDVIEKFKRLVTGSGNADADNLLGTCRNVLDGVQTPDALLRAIKAIQE
jgi:2-methylcitrate dehydratase PrpD